MVADGAVCKGCTGQVQLSVTHGLFETDWLGPPARHAHDTGTERRSPAQVLRGNEVVHEGNIVSLRRVKDNVQEVLAQPCRPSQCLSCLSTRPSMSVRSDRS